MTLLEDLDNWSDGDPASMYAQAAARIRELEKAAADRLRLMAGENEHLRLALGTVRAMHEPLQSRSGPAVTICEFIDATLAQCIKEPTSTSKGDASA